MRAGWTAALDARAELKLGRGAPIPDILRLVEDSPGGVPVGVLALPDGIAGAYARQRGHAFVFVNGREWPVRQRFTLAHEYGHHRLGHASVVDPDEVLSGKTKDQAEIQANAFAAEFLVPREALREWVDAHAVEGVSLETIVRAANYFTVSARVIRYRLPDCDLLARHGARPEALDNAIASGEHTALTRTLGLREPVDSLSELRRTGVEHMPKVMQDWGIQGYAKGLVPIERLAAGLRRSVEDLAAELVERDIHPPPDEPDY